MTARQIAAILSDIETFLVLTGADETASRPYGRAARTLESSEADLTELARQGLLSTLPGIGKGLAAELAAIVTTGVSARLEELIASLPPGLPEILEIRGLGAKKVRALHQQLGIGSLDDLEAAARAGRIASLAGFGKKSEGNILEGIEELRRRRTKMRLNAATRLADEIVASLRELPLVGRASIAGRLRRGAEELDSLSFVVECSDPESLAASLRDNPILGDIELANGTISAVADGTYPVRIHTATSDRYIVSLYRHTGASDHLFMVSLPLLANGYDLRDDGLYRGDELVVLEREEELFELAGIQPIAPELREGIDEVRRAIDGTLPELIVDQDMRGVLHVHTTWSDGANTLEEMAEAARSLGYRYLLISDHSKAAFYANGLDEDRLYRQGLAIDELNARYDPAEFRLLKGIECDILANGTMDLSDDALEGLDAVVASVHSSFALPIEEQTERVCRALAHPYVSILAHPTGRKILMREGYKVDLREVIATAAAHGKSIEINANPARLDLSWRMTCHARRKGVPITINPDAHSTAELANVAYGIRIARKAGLAKEHVLNTLDADDFIAAVRAMRETRLEF